MVDRIEVDYAQLQQIQKRLQARADELEQDYHTLRSKGRDLREVWRGEGADNFFNEMSDLTMPAYRRLIESLDKIYHALNQIAQMMRTAEEQASNLFKGGTATMELRAVAVGASMAGQSPSPANYKDGGLYGENKQPFDGKADVIFIPGILTNPDGFEDHIARTMGKYPDDMQIAAIFNRSDGFLDDIDQAISDRSDATFNNRFGNHNPVVETLKDQVRQAILDGRPLTLEAHSQGGAITSAALMDLYRENPNYDFSNLTVKTFGSAGTQFPPGANYTHYVIAGDPVPLLAGVDDSATRSILGGQFLNNREYYANVVFLPPGDSGDLATRLHGMESYDARIQAGQHTPSVNQIVDTIGDISTQVLDKGKDLFNGLKSLAGGGIL